MLLKRIYLGICFILPIMALSVILYFFLKHFLHLWWILLVISIFLTAIFNIWIFISKRNDHTKNTWIIVISILPLVGVLLFLIYGQKYQPTKSQAYYLKKYQYLYKHENWEFTKQFLKSEDNKIANNQLQCSTNWAMRPLYERTKVDIFTNGLKKFISLFEDLSNAKKYIHLNYFILEEGEILEQFISILAYKVSQGVTVRLIYDDAGNLFTIKRKSIKKMKDAGIIIKKFSPVYLPFIYGKDNYRNHRKDVIIDGKIGYNGGINIGNDYVHLKKKYGFWRDTHLRLEGNAVRSIALIFMQDWYLITKEDLSHNQELLQIVPYALNSSSVVQIVDDGPNIEESIQRDILIKFISSAKKRIWISTPYLVLSNDLVHVLITAVKSNIDVRIVMPGLTDRRFVLDLSRSYYDDLIKAGVKIYEIYGSFNHSKMSLFDDDLMIIGSTNIDVRSLYQDYQTFVVIYDHQIGVKLQNDFIWDFNHSKLIDISPLKKRNWLYRNFILLVMRIISPLF